MRYIADANVLLPILAAGHAFREPALQWWEECDDGDAGLCLPVQMRILRLLTNKHVMGSSILRPEAAWDAVGRMLDDPRVVRIVEYQHSASSSASQPPTATRSSRA